MTLARVAVCCCLVAFSPAPWVLGQETSAVVPPCPEAAGRLDFDEASEVVQFSLSHDGRSALLARGNGAVLVDTLTGRIQAQLDGRGIDQFRFSPLGRLILHKSQERVVVYAAGQITDPIHLFPAGPGASWGEMAVSGDDRLLAVVAETGRSWENRLQIFDLTTGEEVFRIAYRFFRPQALSFSRDRRLLAVRPSDNTRSVQVWDLDRKERVRRFDSMSDGEVVFLTGRDELVEPNPKDASRLWDVSTGREVAHRESSLPPADGFANSPSPPLAAFWSRYPNPNLLLWDSEAHQPVCRVSGPGFLAAGFSGDGSTLGVLEGSRGAGPASSRNPSPVLTLHRVPGQPVDREFFQGTLQLPAPEERPGLDSQARQLVDEPDLGAFVPRGQGDHCEIHLVNLAFDEDSIDAIDRSGTLAEFNQRTLEAGLGGKVGEFETELGEETLTQRSFPLPGLDWTVTAAVYYTDESMLGPMGWDSMRLSLAANPEGPVENPFSEGDAVVAEFTYTSLSGKARVVKRIAGEFLILMECDTTRKFF